MTRWLPWMLGIVAVAVVVALWPREEAPTATSAAEPALALTPEAAAAPSRAPAVVTSTASAPAAPPVFPEGQETKQFQNVGIAPVEVTDQAGATRGAPGHLMTARDKAQWDAFFHAARLTPEQRQTFQQLLAAEDALWAANPDSKKQEVLLRAQQQETDRTMRAMLTEAQLERYQVLREEARRERQSGK